MDQRAVVRKDGRELSLHAAKQVNLDGADLAGQAFFGSPGGQSGGVQRQIGCRFTTLLQCFSDGLPVDDIGFSTGRPG